MIDVVNEFISFLGLNYSPATLPDMFEWLVMVMICCSMLSGIIRTMFNISWGWRK